MSRHLTLPLLITLAAACGTPASLHSPADPGAPLAGAVDGQAPPPAAMVLDAETCVVQGEVLAVTVSGAPPNRRAWLVAGASTTVGAPFCPFPDGSCIDLKGTPKVLGSKVASSDGVVRFTITIPTIGGDLNYLLQVASVAASGAAYLSQVSPIKLDGPGNSGTGTAGLTWQPVSYNPANGHRYQAVDATPRIAFNQARDEAETQMELCRPGHLVTVQDQAEQDYLNARLDPSRHYWIGLFQDLAVPGFQEPADGFAWLTGVPVTYTNWNTSEPNNSAGVEHYIEMLPTGVWNDNQDLATWVSSFYIEYDDELPIVDPLTGHGYQYITTPAAWVDAMQIAQSTVFRGVRGHLATLTSDAEQQFFIDNVYAPVDLNGPWLGGYQDYLSLDYTEPAGGWRWVNQEAFAHTQWAPGEPSDSGGEGFIESWYFGDGQWNDAEDQDKHYIIEFDAQDLTPTTTALVWMPFEGRFDDVSGDHHGTVDGSYDFVFPSPPSSLGPNALQPVTDISHVDLASSADLSVAESDAFTIAMWIRPDEVILLGGYRALAMKHPEPGQETPDTHYGSLLLSDGYLAWDYFYSGEIRSSQQIQEGVWTHVAVTNDGAGTWSLYINGAVDGTGSFAPGAGLEGTQGEDPWIMTLGPTASLYPSEGYIGAIDDFVYFDRALDAVAMELLKNAGPRSL